MLGLGIFLAVVLGVIWIIRVAKAWEERTEPKPNPLVQHTLALLEVTRAILSVRR